MIELGNRIRNARERAGLTQEQLAERIGTSRAAIARYESGEIEPKLRNLAAIAVELHVSADYLLDIPPSSPARADLSPAAEAALESFIREIRKKKP